MKLVRNSTDLKQYAIEAKLCEQHNSVIDITRVEQRFLAHQRPFLWAKLKKASLCRSPLQEGLQKEWHYV